MQKKLPRNKYQYGFNLIELLIAVAIMGILFGLGYANYRDFSRRQALTNAAESVIADLRLAQSLAASGQLPTDITKCRGTNYLQGYNFNVLSTTQYEIRAACSNGDPANPFKVANVATGMTVTTPSINPVLFKVLGSGTNIGDTDMIINVVQTYSGSAIGISVTKSGQVQTTTAVFTSPAPTGIKTPTPAPTSVPTSVPTSAPTAAPTAVPTSVPTSAPTATPVPGNLIANPGCETNTTGWIGFQGTLSRNTSLHQSGVASCQVAWTSSTYYTMDDSPATVTNPTFGNTYTASAYVRTDTAVGKTINVILRYGGGTHAQATVQSTNAMLSTSWQQISISAPVDFSDRTSLEVYFYQPSAVSGNSFQVDTISLTKS